MQQIETAIILVDDHVLVRGGISTLLQQMGNYKIIQEYSNGRMLLNYLSAVENTFPDLIIMDLDMPEVDGHEAMKVINKQYPFLKVIILTWDTNERKIIDLFRLGVRGYLLKNCTADILKRAIDDTMSSGYYHSEIFSSALKKGMTEKDILSKVTDRERQFLQLVCNKDEYTYDQMAELMGVHRRTVDGYRESLFQKFNIKSKTGLVLFAIKNGIVSI